MIYSMRDHPDHENPDNDKLFFNQVTRIPKKEKIDLIIPPDVYDRLERYINTKGLL